MTPTWPRLAGWLTTAQVQTLQGEWSSLDPDRGRSSGPFAFEAPDRWSRPEPADLLQPGGWSRGDFHLPAGPVVEDEHDGRPAWKVELLAPAHKTGRLEVWVDQQWHLLVRQRNTDAGYDEQVSGLVVDAALPPGAFIQAEQRAREDRRLRALYDMLSTRPPPTPRWWPHRLVRTRAGLVELDDGFVGRAREGSAVPTSEWGHDHVVDIRVDGWHWKVGASWPVTEEQARTVVDHALQASRGDDGAAAGADLARD